MTRIRVVLVDDNEAVRKGLQVFLETCDDIELVGEAANEQAALNVCRTTRPDVVIVDIDLGNHENGLVVIARIQEELPRIRSIILSGYLNETLLREALVLGVPGYLEKNVTIDDLANAIRRVVNGERVLCKTARQIYARLYPDNPVG